MPALSPGDVWFVDLGMAAKARPCLVLTPYPADDELALVSIVAHTRSVKGNRWEISIPKPFLDPGAFHIQQVQSVPLAKFERKLGQLTTDEFRRVQDALKERFSI
jgi:mRNA interferase MazF